MTTNAAHQPITLFDIPTREPRKSSSQNVWKVRSLLNYKNLEYTTEWLEYTEMHERLKALGVPPNQLGGAVYTPYWCPVVRLPDGTCIVESHKISLALEKLHPTPDLQVSSPKTEEAQGLVDMINYTLCPAYIYRLADDALSPASGVWYHEQRGRLFGVKDCYEIAKMAPWADGACWENAKEPIAAMARFLKEREGPYVMGDTLTYADLVVGSHWEFYRLVSRDGDLFDRLMKMDPAFARHEEAVRPWFKRDDH